MFKRGTLLVAITVLFLCAAPLSYAAIISSQTTDESAAASAIEFFPGLPIYFGLDYGYSLGNGFSGTLDSLKIRFNGQNGNSWLVDFYCRTGSSFSDPACASFNTITTATQTSGAATTTYTATWSGTHMLESDKFYFFHLNIAQTAESSIPATVVGSLDPNSNPSGVCNTDLSSTGLCDQVVDPYFELNATPLDTTAPVITISSGPADAGYASSTSVSYAFSTDDPAAVTTCAWDGMATSTCSSPTATSTLAEGAHTFILVATDTSGNAATTTRTFTVDTIAPTLIITSGTLEGAFASSSSVSFGFNNSDPVDTLCSFDTSATSTCVAVAASTTLADGTHTLYLATTDAAGNATSTSRTFIIDTTAPTLTIDIGVAEGAVASTSAPSFSYSASDTGGVTVTCFFDALAAGSCVSPTSTPLSDGAHSFNITVTDAAGNATSTSRNFSIDTTAPVLSEVAAIATSTNTTPSYSFTSTETGTLSFTGACSAATSTANLGTSTITFNALSVGTYSSCSLSVTDAAGNIGTLSISPFQIEAVPPPPPPIGSVGNGPPVENPSQGLPQGLVLGVATKAVEHASDKAKSIIEYILPPAKVTAPSTPKQEVTEEAPEPVITPWEKPVSKQPQLAAAAATSDFTLPLWAWLEGGALLLIIGRALVLRPKN